MEGWREGWTDRQTERWVDGQTDGPEIHGSTPFPKAFKFASLDIMVLPVQNACGN